MNVLEHFTEQHIQNLHQLYQNEWWTRGRTLSDTRKCIYGSQICLGITDDLGKLKAFTRILTDYIYKALIFDLIVNPDDRGQGLGDRLMIHALEHPKLREVKHFELYCLPEMFSFYKKYGFTEQLGRLQLLRCNKLSRVNENTP